MKPIITLPFSIPCFKYLIYWILKLATGKDYSRKWMIGWAEWLDKKFGLFPHA